MREDSLLVNVKLVHTWHRSLKAGLILKGIWKVPWNNAPMEQVTLEQAEDEGRSLHVRQIGTRTRTGKGSSGLGTLSMGGARVGYSCDEPWEMRWANPAAAGGASWLRAEEMHGDGGWWRVSVPKPGGGLGDAPAPSWG